jgi:hypothetical protein
MYSVRDTACAVGFPIRKSSDQRLLPSPRRLSQGATSFIASWYQGIHQMPFSRLRPVRRDKPDKTLPRQKRPYAREVSARSAVVTHRHPAPGAFQRRSPRRDGPTFRSIITWTPGCDWGNRSDQSDLIHFPLYDVKQRDGYDQEPRLLP